MGQLNSFEYYSSREGQEILLADRASDPAIARIHRDMAAQYAVLARQAQAAGDGQASPRRIALSAGSPGRGAGMA